MADRYQKRIFYGVRIPRKGEIHNAGVAKEVYTVVY